VFTSWQRAGSAFIKCAAILGLMSLAGCESLAFTVFGVGASTGVQHQLNGVAYKTFTVPLPQVHKAAMGGLDRMGIKVVSRQKIEAGGELIRASAPQREIEIEFNAITPYTTRMRASVRDGWLMDSATGTEIILQTEKGLNDKGMSTVRSKL
jgi:uncharacterized protein DUF3568